MKDERTAVLAAFDTLRAKVAQPGHWIQGAYRSRTGQQCLIGAIYYGVLVDVAAPVAQAISREIPITAEFPSVSHWNDAPGRTVDEVLDLIDRARAAYAEASR